MLDALLDCDDSDVAERFLAPLIMVNVFTVAFRGGKRVSKFSLGFSTWLSRG